MTPIEWAVVGVALLGAFFGGVAALGILRLPDVYTRAHAASKSDTLGAVLTVGAAALALQSDISTVKAVFLLTFLFITNPTAAHAIARAAQDQGIEPWTLDDEEGEA
ncbi:monovalent cation/H(+) antiporter subunit G [Haloarcula litorea]|uniref:monovalent cation/H(+) antiporter subunit G n=1 Tax=Haloarcula litorea TaxID=3032579 RepID=UPI0023E8A600|nr:monovalent cation/H(+) antiporter subunit G [Halomicroarcula sp. GDY20]